MLQNPNPYVTFPQINQSDTAAILYSSGTTGQVKGVELTHRNFIAIASAAHHNRFVMKEENNAFTSSVLLFLLPLFHVIGFFVLISAVSTGQKLVLMERFNFEEMFKAVEKYKVMYL